MAGTVTSLTTHLEGSSSAFVVADIGRLGWLQGAGSVCPKRTWDFKCYRKGERGEVEVFGHRKRWPSLTNPAEINIAADSKLLLEIWK